MRKTLKRFKPYLGYFLALVVLVVGVFGVVGAQQPNIFNIGTADFTFGGDSSLGGPASVSDESDTGFTDVDIDGDLTVGDTTTLTGTTTIGYLSYDSTMSKSLTFTAGSTSTFIFRSGDWRIASMLRGVPSPSSPIVPRRDAWRPTPSKAVRSVLSGYYSWSA